MGGELWGPGGGAPRFTRAQRLNGGPGACPRFGRLG